MDTCCQNYETPELAGAEKISPGSITMLLARSNSGDRDAFDRLIPLVYPELHRIAEGYLRRESWNQTLQPTALVNEAYLKLAEFSLAGDYQSRKHFFVIAAKVMRQILVDHARARLAAKRGANMTVALDQDADLARQPERIVIALDDAMRALAVEDERQARMVELRFFGGMTAAEIADCVSAPVHVVRRELRCAQAWLRRQIEA